MRVSQHQITLAARELFRRRGFAGASMQDLAEVVGLKKASLYSRVIGKEALVVEVLSLTLAETLAAAEGAKGWRARYEALLRGLGETLVQNGRCVAFHLAYGVSAETPGALAAVRRYFVACRAALAEPLIEIVGEVEADEVAADALARIEGATLWLALNGEVATMQRAIDDLLAQADAMAAGSRV